MELVEPIERINQSLEREYGVYHDGRPRFRVVFSEGLTEKRWVTHTKDGFQLLSPVVEEVRKYGYISERYVLEQLVEIPDGVETDQIEKIIYDPLWTFQDRHGDYLPPRFDMCKVIIDHIYVKAMGTDKTIYKEDLDKESKELARVEEFLFGNETKETDALGLGTGVTDFNPKVNFNEVN